MITAAEGGQATTSQGYRSADAMAADLRLIEEQLRATGRSSIGSMLVRPVRREVESFRFSTVRLDLRENTTKLNAALADLWRVTNGQTEPAPDQGSDAWRQWIAGELARPLTSGNEVPQLPPDSRETLGMFELVRDLREEIDREAFGTFILSMTRSVSDIL